FFVWAYLVLFRLGSHFFQGGARLPFLVFERCSLFLEFGLLFHRGRRSPLFLGLRWCRCFPVSLGYRLRLRICWWRCGCFFLFGRRRRSFRFGGLRFADRGIPITFVFSWFCVLDLRSRCVRLRFEVLAFRRQWGILSGLLWLGLDWSCYFLW